MLSKSVLVPIANGTEEIEAVTILDVLRRAGLNVRAASIEGREITAANGTRIVADSDYDDEIVLDYDAIVLPGGTEGAKRFFAHEPLVHSLKQALSKNNLIAAICASPALVLAQAGILDGKKATCYPSFKQYIKNYVDEKVVVDGNIITSQGPGTALAFSLKLVETLIGAKVASELKADLLV